MPDIQECKHESIKLYDGEWKCMLCFVPFVRKHDLRLRPVEPVEFTKWYETTGESLLKTLYTDKYGADTEKIDESKLRPAFQLCLLKAWIDSRNFTKATFLNRLKRWMDNY